MCQYFQKHPDCVYLRKTGYLLSPTSGNISRLRNLTLGSKRPWIKTVLPNLLRTYTVIRVPLAHGMETASAFFPEYLLGLRSYRHETWQTFAGISLTACGAIMVEIHRICFLDMVNFVTSLHPLVFVGDVSGFLKEQLYQKPSGDRVGVFRRPHPPPSRARDNKLYNDASAAYRRGIPIRIPSLCVTCDVMLTSVLGGTDISFQQPQCVLNQRRALLWTFLPIGLSSLNQDVAIPHGMT